MIFFCLKPCLKRCEKVEINLTLFSLVNKYEVINTIREKGLKTLKN